MEITPEMANKYGLSKVDGISTTNGFINIVKDAQSQGMNRVHFTKALDLLMQPYGKDRNMVRLATDTIYDFNGTKIQLIDPQNAEQDGYQILNVVYRVILLIYHI